jgi:hypothetical protein
MSCHLPNEVQTEPTLTFYDQDLPNPSYPDESKKL